MEDTIRDGKMSVAAGQTAKETVDICSEDVRSEYIRNRCYDPRHGKTPFEMMTEQKPDMKNMHIFAAVLCIIRSKKLDARSERVIYIGYDAQSSAYLVYFPQQNNVKRVKMCEI